MKLNAARILLLLAFAAQNAQASTPEAPTDEIEIVEPADAASGPASASASPDDSLEDFCFIPGEPPATAPYTVLKKLKTGKQTYGHVAELLPKIASAAKFRGADAVIRYNGSQRFGFWPWRVVRPVVSGVAIKWNDTQARSCAELGGATLKTIRDENLQPTQIKKNR